MRGVSRRGFSLSMAAAATQAAFAQRGGGLIENVLDAAQKAAAEGPAIASGPVQPTWDSVRAHYKTPAWFKPGRFGIFMHWGLYAVPAHGSEWYVQRMYSPGAAMQWQVQKYGPLDKFGYKDFIPLFTCEKYDPDAWVELFKAAGANYIVPTAQHHDQFALWDSDLTKWCAGKMGPKRDLIGDLAKAARRGGLKFGVSNHGMEHYGFIRAPQGIKTDLDDPANDDFYGVLRRQQPGSYEKFLADWVARNFELIDKYQPDLLWFDNGVNGRDLDPVKLKVAAHLYNRAAGWGKEVSFVTKAQAYLAGSIFDLERGRAVDIRRDCWQCETSMGHNSWGYTEDLVLRNSGEMIRELIDSASKDGNYLLNIAPKKDGTIPGDQALRLREMGQWLRQNGEGIYDTTAWTHYGEGPTPQTAASGARGITDAMLKVYTAQDFRFTVKGNTLYAFGFAWPEYPGNAATIKSLALKDDGPGKVAAVTLLGSIQKTAFKQDAEGLHVTLPAWKTNEYAYTLKIEGLKLM